MDFYTELSRHYDEIFAVSDGEMRFIGSLVPENSALLDIGCGTGNKTEILARNAASMDAVDLDKGMIDIARRAHALPHIRYAVLDMRNVGQAYAGKQFGGALCLGNTLVHLLSTGEILSFLRSVHTMLAPGGALVIQILNYDRILARNITTLPPIDTPAVRFLREYTIGDGELRFRTTLEIKDSGQRLHSDIPLFPLKKAELTSLLSDAGFTAPRYFGSFQGDPHTDDSFVTIATSLKA